MDSAKKSVLLEKFLAHQPVRPVVCGLVSLVELRKVFAGTTLEPIFRCASAASYLSSSCEAYCDVEDFEHEIGKWKEVSMFGETTEVLIDSLLQQIKLKKYEIIIFDNSIEVE